MPGIECLSGTGGVAKQIPVINRPLPPRASSLLNLSIFFLVVKIPLRSWCWGDGCHSRASFSIFNNNGTVFFFFTLL